MQSRVAMVTASLANPLGPSWIWAINRLGARVVVLSDHDNILPTNAIALGNIEHFDSDTVRRSLDDPSMQLFVERELGGSPDILFGWWGSGILPRVRAVKRRFPAAKVVLCVDTLPNASNPATELRELLRLNFASSWIDGYIFYSSSMRRAFHRRVPRSRSKHFLEMIQPFPSDAFARSLRTSDRMPALVRHDNEPHVIFTGRGDLLWTNDFRKKKDAVGEFLTALASLGVHVYLPYESDTKSHLRLHRYPRFSPEELFSGVFARYISQFDAHLVFYNEHNGTIRRRVSNGLSTRLALAVTAQCPIAVTRSSTFALEYFQPGEGIFTFTDVHSLRSCLRDEDLLANCRSSLAGNAKRFSIESQQRELVRFFEGLLSPSSLGRPTGTA